MTPVTSLSSQCRKQGSEVTSSIHVNRGNKVFLPVGGRRVCVAETKNQTEVERKKGLLTSFVGEIDFSFSFLPLKR